MPQFKSNKWMCRNKVNDNNNNNDDDDDDDDETRLFINTKGNL